MQELFEKIIEKLEERTEFLSDCTKYGNKDAEQQNKSYSTMMMYEVADLVDDLIEIVKQEAEQFGTDTNVGSNGWIPCNVALPPQPEENPVFENKPLELYLVSVRGDKYPFRAFWNGKFFTDGWSKLEAVAWQPLPPKYQSKGE